MNASLNDASLNETSPAGTATAVIDTPIGPLTLVASDRGLRAVMWPDEEFGRVKLDATAEPAAGNAGRDHPANGVRTTRRVLRR